MEHWNKATVLEKTRFVRVMGSQNARDWREIVKFPVEDYHKYGIDVFKPDFGFIQVEAYDDDWRHLGILEDWDSSSLCLAPNGRLYPKAEAIPIDRECQIRKLRGTLNKVTSEAATMYEWYRECQAYAQELREAIDYLEREEFISGKGILKVDEGRVRVIPKPKAKSALAKAPAAVKKSGGAFAILDMLKASNPKKYQEVLKAMVAQGAELPEGHYVED